MTQISNLNFNNKSKNKKYKSRYKYQLTQTSRELVQNYISSFHIDREWLSEIIEYIPYLVFENLT
jgi:hypothetical protein